MLGMRQIFFPPQCNCTKLPVSSHPPISLDRDRPLSVHFHLIWFQDSIHSGMWLRNKTPWRAIVCGVMAVRRRPQVELLTECLKCADSRPGWISLGLHMKASWLYFSKADPVFQFQIINLYVSSIRVFMTCWKREASTKKKKNNSALPLCIK